MSMSVGKSMAGPEQKGLNGGVRRFERQSDFVVALAFYFAKRGKPPGALLHALHRFELTRLPGLLQPTRQRYSAW